MINRSFTIRNHVFNNRVVFQPMEGADCLPDGTPSEYTLRKYMRFASAGSGLLWFEANAVCPEGKANPRQMMLTGDNLDSFKKMVEDVREKALKDTGTVPRMILQLTHSGRQSVNRVTMYKNDVYEAQGKTGPILDDDYLDRLPERYTVATRLAEEAGFDGVDVKACHVYLLMEAMSAFNREGKYGGSFENRIRLYRNCLAAARDAKKADTLLAARLGLCDMVAKPNGFGTDENNNPALSEPVELIKILQKDGLELLNITIGNPYYNPHVNRPFKVGPYKAPESAETGLERFKLVNRTVKEACPDLPIVGSGLSYYRENMVEEASRMIEEGICDFAGFGRIILAYPEFYRDHLAGGIEKKKLCALCSKCTELMRAGCVSGCALHDEVYREIYRGIKK